MHAFTFYKKYVCYFQISSDSNANKLIFLKIQNLVW